MSGKRARTDRALAAGRSEPMQMVAPGVCLNTPAAIADLRRRTHDGVIAEAGPRRRSGVTWYEFAMPQALEVLEEVTADDPAVEVYRTYLRTNGERALLIVAAVDVDGPRVFTGPS